MIFAQSNDTGTPRDSAAAESEAKFLNGDAIDEYLASEYFLAVEGNPTAYGGVYSFGDSEWEWTLTIGIISGKVTAKYRYGRWANNAENWLKFTKTVGSALIDGFVFKGKSFGGVFVRHRTTGELGLVLTNGHIANSPELGHRLNP